MTGPDGLPSGGGTGIWTINKTGNGKLIVKGSNLPSGNTIVDGGTLDLSNTISNGLHDLFLNKDTILIYKPTHRSSIQIRGLSISESTILNINRHSSIVAKNVILPNNFSISIDPTDADFIIGNPVNIITWEMPINIWPQISITEGYSYSIGDDGISITRNA